MANTDKPEAKPVMTTREMADALKTDPKTLRTFLRSEGSPVKNPGKGARYQFEKNQVPAIRKGFTAFLKARDEARAKAKAEREAEKTKSE
jgi:hypothetical protein